MKHTTRFLFLAVSTLWVAASLAHAAESKVPLYRIFEKSVLNEKPYANKFADVRLTTQFQAPSGRIRTPQGPKRTRPVM